LSLFGMLFAPCWIVFNSSLLGEKFICPRDVVHISQLDRAVLSTLYETRDTVVIRRYEHSKMPTGASAYRLSPTERSRAIMPVGARTDLSGSVLANQILPTIQPEEAFLSVLGLRQHCSESTWFGPARQLGWQIRSQ
jgi:hypothetical protein